MSSMENEQEDPRRKRIEELLYMLGGLEASILTAMEDKDYDFLKSLKSKKADYYERLRRVSYGLSEERKVPPTE